MKAVYPGTFDPATFGHLDVIKRGIKLFSPLIVAVSDNPRKKPLFSVEERVELLKNSVDGIEGVEIKSFDSLLVDFMRKENASVILRGLRETSDFPSEFQQAIINREFDDSVETVFVMTNANNFYVTSSMVKEIAFHKGSVEEFVPKNVASSLIKKINSL